MKAAVSCAAGAAASSWASSAIAAFFLLSEHRAHLLGFLRSLLLLACPLIHVFMHGGHGASDRASNAGRPSGSVGPESHQH